MRHLEFPFSYYRPHVETPATVSDIDIEKLKVLDGFLEKNKLVVLDDTAASYRYGAQKYGASVSNLKSYIGYNQLRAHIRNQVTANSESKLTDVLLDLEERARQVGHRAKNLEVNLGMFYGLALMRNRALTQAVKSLNNTGELPDDLYTRHCADAIVDMGQAMMNPKTIPAPTARNRKFDVIHASSMQEFGVYAHEVDRGLLASNVGLHVMHIVNKEQERRVRTFSPRYKALISVVGSQIPSQIISSDMSDEELLDISFIDPSSVD